MSAWRGSPRRRLRGALPRPRRRGRLEQVDRRSRRRGEGARRSPPSQRRGASRSSALSGAESTRDGSERRSPRPASQSRRRSALAAEPPPRCPRRTPPRPAPPPRRCRRRLRPRRAAEPWGRVEDDGTVSVREADGWRVVGQYPDGSPEEALAYFERKYADLASEVGLLEVRQRRGGASAADLRSAARAVNAKLDGAAAVGDLASLVARVAALTERWPRHPRPKPPRRAKPSTTRCAPAPSSSRRSRRIAARDPRSVQWKQASAEVTALFDEWQSQQQNGPRLPKSTAQQLWKRFRDARATFDKHRREFYAELDEAHKGVRERKTRLVEKAEALAPKGEDGIPAYRDLLDEWKTAGRAGKKVDDALWARFKAAGDALYGARIERETADAEASREKIEAKRALLEEAAPSPTSARSRRRARCSPRSSASGTRSAASSRARRSARSTTTCARSSRRCARAKRPTGSATTPRPRRARTT